MYDRPVFSRGLCPGFPRLISGEAGFRAGETGALCKTVRSCFGFPVAYACQEKAWLCFGKTPVLLGLGKTILISVLWHHRR